MLTTNGTESNLATTRLAVLLFTDIAGSTEHKSKIGTAAYANLLARHNELFETGIRRISGGEIIKHTGDGYFASFPAASDAVRFALEFQVRMKLEAWGDRPLRTRLGIHIGEVAVLDMAGRTDVVGLSADMAARIMSLALEGQILLTRGVFDDARQFVSAAPPLSPTAAGQDKSDTNGGNHALRWIAHGPYLFKGSEEPLDVFEVGIDNFSPLTRPPDSEKVKRVVPHDQEATLGWRPAIGLEIPSRPGWTLDRKLGDGGFGEVWLGVHNKLKEHRVFKFCFDVDRLRSFKRELTLFRLLRDALGDRSDIARLYEVKLDHPPFFLESEYAAGGDLIDWAERQGGIDTVPLKIRLELVEKIANAVAAAHSVGILHKDIKPSNVLMHETGDGRVKPVLADFGIGVLSDRTQLRARSITETGFTELTMTSDTARTGTRLYSPPESLLNKPFTTQGDVYALGVLLYQAVVGDLRRPLAPGWERDITDDLLREDIAGMVEGDPTRRTASAAKAAEQIGSLEIRRAEQQKQSALAAAMARRKHLARLLVTASAILVMMAVATGAAMWLHIRGLKQEQSRTSAALAEAKNQAAIAEAVRSFLTDDVLSAARPEIMPDKQVRDAIVKGMLDPAANAVAERFKDQPLIQAAVRGSLAQTYQALGRADLALPHAQIAMDIRRRLLGVDNIHTLRSIDITAGLLKSQGKLDQAEPLYREALAGLRRVFGDDHPDTLNSITNLGALLRARGEFDQAVPLLSEALERSRKVLGDDHPNTLAAIGNMALLLQAQGKLDRAEPLYREALASSRRILGDDYPDTIKAINNMGFLLKAQGRLDEAEPLYHEALERTRRVLGDDHPSTLAAMNNMGSLLQADGKLDQAEPFYREVIERSRRVLGPDHPHTLSSINNMGSLLQAEGKLEEAEPFFRETLNGRRRVLGDEHPDTLASINNMGYRLLQRGKLGEAEPLLREALAGWRKTLGPAAGPTTRNAARLEQALIGLHRDAEADAIRTEYHLTTAATQPVTSGSPTTEPTMNGS